MFTLSRAKVPVPQVQLNGKAADILLSHVREEAEENKRPSLPSPAFISGPLRLRRRETYLDRQYRRMNSLHRLSWPLCVLFFFFLFTHKCASANSVQKETNLNYEFDLAPLKGEAPGSAIFSERKLKQAFDNTIINSILGDIVFEVDTNFIPDSTFSEVTTIWHCVSERLTDFSPAL